MGKPIMILKGLNYLRYLSIIILILISIASVMLIEYVGVFIVFLGLYCLYMILFIRFPSIYVFKEQIVVIRKSILPLFSVEKIYKNEDIKDVKFNYRYTNWIKIFFISIIPGYLRANMSENNSKSDTLLIETNKEKIEISRIGKRKDFMNLYEVINQLLSTQYL